MKQKKLMILIWNMGLGGIQKRVRDISIDISQNYPQCNLYLLVKFKQPSFFLKEIENLPNVEIRYCSHSHKKSNAWPSFFWVLRNYLDIQPDICLTFLEHLSITMVIIKYLTFWRRVKIILNEGVFTSTYLKINRAFFWQYLIKIFYPLADKVIVPTVAIKQNLHRKFKVPEKKIVVIPNWTLFSPQLKSKKPKYDLAFIGRFDKEKNPLDFIFLVNTLLSLKPNIKAVMIGDGRQKDLVLSLIKKYHLQKSIDLIGPMSTPQDYLQQTKVLVMTTLNEGLPNVVLEAGMLQVPTVTTHFAGAKEVIEDGRDGFIAENFSELVTRTFLLLQNEKKRQVMGQAIQQKVLKKFSRSRQTQFIHHLID
jgi:glycosyltransferase involved in cell wall biosynthesis